jgi:general secretion pathway protein B
MSYILEALKKAQAERQLGALPTIHAPTLQGGMEQPPVGGLKKPVALALGGMGVVIVALLALVWSKSQQPAPVVAAAPAAASPAAAPPAPAPAPAAAPAAVVPAALPAAAMAVPPPAAQPPAPGAIAPPVAPTVQSAPSASPALPELVVASAKKPAAPAVTAAARSAPPAAVLSAPPAAAPAARASLPAAGAAPVAAAAAVATTPSPAPQDDITQTIRDLPEPIQRSIPPIAVGGYIYSKNPADRLLLIDKVLRHEGEEVAPGLLLEKLQPKSAIFNFKGYRYRVPY